MNTTPELLAGAMAVVENSDAPWDKFAKVAAEFERRFVESTQNSPRAIHADAARIVCAELRRVQPLAELATTCCDKLDDRMYHAEDQTWWRRENDRWVSSDHPAGWERIKKHG